MKIELRKVKYYEKLSDESSCMTADLYVNDKLVGYVKNDGHGGNTSVQPINKDVLIQFRAAEAFCKLLPAKMYDTFSIDMDLEVYVDNLFDEFMKKRDYEKLIKRLDKDCETKVVLMTKATLDKIKAGDLSVDLSYSLIKYKKPLVEYGPDMLRLQIEKIKNTRMKPGEVIYNDFSFLDMLYSPVANTDYSVVKDWARVDANIKANQAHMDAIDLKAKDKGQILYRFFDTPVADGKAFYQVIAVKGTKARVAWCPGIIADNYQDRILGAMAEMPLKQVTQMIHGRDKLNLLFSKKGGSK